MLQTTDESSGNGSLSILTNASKKNQDAPNGGNSRDVDGNIKNLSSVVKSAKSKKPNFVKNNSSKTEFLILRAKKAFIYLRKAFTKAPIYWHFNPKRYIHIETDALGYAISGVLSQIIWDQHSSSYVTYKDSNSDFSKSKISQ